MIIVVDLKVLQIRVIFYSTMVYAVMSDTYYTSHKCTVYPNICHRHSVVALLMLLTFRFNRNSWSHWCSGIYWINGTQRRPRCSRCSGKNWRYRYT